MSTIPAVSLITSERGALIVGLCLSVIMVAVVAVFFYIPESWESEHREDILQLVDEALSLNAEGDAIAAELTYARLVDLVDDQTITDSVLQRRLEVVEIAMSDIGRRAQIQKLEVLIPHINDRLIPELMNGIDQHRKLIRFQTAFLNAEHNSSDQRWRFDRLYLFERNSSESFSDTLQAIKSFEEGFGNIETMIQRIEEDQSFSSRPEVKKIIEQARSSAEGWLGIIETFETLASVEQSNSKRLMANRYYLVESKKRETFDKALSKLAEHKRNQRANSSNNSLTSSHSNTHERSPGGNAMFYNPSNATMPYQSAIGIRHATREEAIQQLAEQFGHSTEWVKENMGTSNDLWDIHRRLVAASTR